MWLQGAVVSYIPSHTYLVVATALGIQALAQSPVWIGPFLPEYKISSSLNSILEEHPALDQLNARNHTRNDLHSAQQMLQTNQHSLVVMLPPVDSLNMTHSISCTLTALTRALGPIKGYVKDLKLAYTRMELNRECKHFETYFMLIM